MPFDRPAYMREYNKRHRALHREDRLADSAAWKRAHPRENAAHAMKFYRSFAGKISGTYAGMRQRVRGKGSKGQHRYRGLYLLPRDLFIAWSLKSPAYRRLHSAWVAAGYAIKISPSIDRKDSSLGYTLSNMRWITHSQNSRQGAINSHKAGVR